MFDDWVLLANFLSVTFLLWQKSVFVFILMFVFLPIPLLTPPCIIHTFICKYSLSSYNAPVPILALGISSVQNTQISLPAWSLHSRGRKQTINITHV